MTDPESTTRNPSRNLRARGRNANLGTGSTLAAQIERIWRKVETYAATAGVTLPTVHIVTGMGAEQGGVKLGHVTVRPVWKIAGKAEGSDPTAAYELFVSGESLGLGAVRALTTILHEATHLFAKALPAERAADFGAKPNEDGTPGVQDTSRGYRYHNHTFVRLAATFALEYNHPAPSKAVGYSDVTLSEFGQIVWGDELAALDAEIKATIPGIELAPWNPADPADPRLAPAPKDGKAPKAPRRRVSYQCQCRTINVFAEEMELGAITCQACGEDFAA